MARAWLGRLAIALMALSVALPASAGRVDEEGPFGFVANVTVLKLVTTAPDTEGGIYAKNTFAVWLRSDNYLTEDNGKPIEFEAVLTTNFDTLPRRVFVVLDSLKAKKIIYWTEVGQYVCVPPEIARSLDKDAEVTIRNGPKDTPCFVTP